MERWNQWITRLRRIFATPTYILSKALEDGEDGLDILLDADNLPQGVQRGPRLHLPKQNGPA